MKLFQYVVFCQLIMNLMGFILNRFNCPVISIICAISIDCNHNF